MSKPDVIAELPAPLSLTLEEASKVAAGAAAPSGIIPWWWKGQAAHIAILNPEHVFTPPVLNGGKVAGF